MKYDVRDLESKRTLGYAQNMPAARLQASRFTTLARVGVFTRGSDKPFLVFRHGQPVQRPAPVVPVPTPAPAQRSSRKIVVRRAQPEESSVSL